jgi:hypothetical protein
MERVLSSGAGNLLRHDQRKDWNNDRKQQSKTTIYQKGCPQIAKQE